MGSIENLGHVVGLLELQLRECLLLDRHCRLLLFLWRDGVGDIRWHYEGRRLLLLLWRRSRVCAILKHCFWGNFTIQKPEVDHLLRQVVANQLLASNDFKDSLSDLCDSLSPLTRKLEELALDPSLHSKVISLRLNKGVKHPLAMLIDNDHARYVLSSSSSRLRLDREA